MKFDRIDWNRVFFKTYYEKRSFGHLLVNFNRIWVIHISIYWYYTAYNSPAVYNALVCYSSGRRCGHCYHDYRHPRGVLVHPH